MNQDNRPRRYLLKPNDGLPFLPGIDAEGKQYLAGWLNDILVVLSFSAQGVLADVDIEPLAEQGATPEEEFASWMESTGFQPVAFHIDAFSIANAPIEVKDLPDEYASYLLALYNDRSRQPDDFLVEIIADWQRDQQYVICWGSEFWMSKEGDLTDT